uniref:SJCHGC09514 protein n=1 Tax=Schistosoma japonicum TaxID=6182 RepID=Q5DHJ0_SCHJA|nr:SJCHGC09514 protein [Schistosoma japonicum]
MQTDLHKIIVSPQPLSLDHVKIFVYQILRGLKYLHSARIIHRDIKPGNMLVNSNCLLKICDFGLARIDDPFGEVVLTQEVVTQYYRSPELLMEATRYSYAVDIWSVGCTFAELLVDVFYFQPRSPLEQLELIINLTGSPSPGDLRKVVILMHAVLYFHQDYVIRIFLFFMLLHPDVNELTVHLLGSMLKFNPRQRISAADALNHPFLEEARLRYHSCMCSCCHDISSTSGNDGVQTSGFCCAPSPSASSSCASSSTPSSDSMQSGNGKCLISRYEAKTAANAVPSSGSSNNHSTFCSTGGTARRRYFHDLDPICSVLLPFDLDSGFRRLSDAKRVLWDSIQEYYRRDDRLTRVVLNRNAANYSNFINSSVAQAKEIPASHRWH